jgi:hypothetical protein
MARAPKPAGSEQDNDDWVPTDSELGVGEATEADTKAAQQEKIAAAMADPVIAQAITDLVQKRVAELAVSQSAPPGTDLVAAMSAFADRVALAINKSTTATMEQIPGHVKPIAPEEVERRAAAWVELQSLLTDTTKRYWSLIQQGEHDEAERVTPRYILDEDFFGPGEVGSEMYIRGETIRWFGVPNLYMKPRNGIATRLGELAWAYLGNEGAPSADDLAKQARDMLRPSTPGAPAAPEMAFLLSEQSRGRPNASRVSEMGIAERGPDNIVGFGHGIVTDGPGLSPQAMQPRGGPHPVRGTQPAEL